MDHSIGVWRSGINWRIKKFTKEQNQLNNEFGQALSNEKDHAGRWR
jgi:hypothetical protein